MPFYDQFTSYINLIHMSTWNALPDQFSNEVGSPRFNYIFNQMTAFEDELMNWCIIRRR
jgi:hypothetical protein